MNARRSLRLAFTTLLALIWSWSLLRVAWHPAQAGPVEQGIAAGGWTLSVLPVHATPWRRRATLRGRYRSVGAAHRTASPLSGPIRPRTPHRTIAAPGPRAAATGPLPTPRDPSAGPATRRLTGATAVSALQAPRGRSSRGPEHGSGAEPLRRDIEG